MEANTNPFQVSFIFSATITRWLLILDRMSALEMLPHIGVRRLPMTVKILYMVATNATVPVYNKTSVTLQYMSELAYFQIGQRNSQLNGRNIELRCLFGKT
jgi:hypothetical protein